MTQCGSSLFFGASHRHACYTPSPKVFPTRNPRQLLFLQMEFESREVALRDALESDFQADLDGQLLLAEIRHQKEIDALRLELSGGKAPLAEAAAGAIVVFNAGSPQCGEKGEGASGASSSARSPSLSRRPLQRRVVSGAGGTLGRKLPVFKTPVQKVSPDVGSKNARR